MAKKLTKEEWIDKFNLIHRNIYDYNDNVNINSRDSIIIECKKHGKFEQNAYVHSKGSGCSDCISDKFRENRKLSKEDIIKKFIEKHGDKYNYSLMEYTGLNSSKIKIICPSHGIFTQYPKNHIKYGCSGCSNNKKYTAESLLDNIKRIHGDEYLYCIPENINNKSRIKIKCKKHGVFEQVILNHISRHGCPNCKLSKGEKSIKLYLDDNNIFYIQQKKFTNCASISKLKFDFYLPEHNTCIEFDGLQHSRPVKLFGGKEAFDNLKRCDSIKNKYCHDNRIKLIRIPYTQFGDIEKIIRGNIPIKAYPTP